jgi:hypothetical protein
MNGAQDQGARPFEPTEDLTPSAIEAYLRMSGWRQADRREGVSAIWHLDEANASLLLPYDRSYRDFSERLSDALYTIADVNDIRSDEALSLEIAGARSDILLLRADQPTLDGSIPLSEARGLLDGVERMLLAAACSAIKPSASIPRRRPDAVKEFMAEEVRMGHTLRGSFVITIFARHDEAHAEELPDSGGPDYLQVADQLPDDPYSPLQYAVSSYTRQVMTTLATGLEAARNLIEGEAVSLDDAVQQGTSAELVDSLGKMSKSPGLRALDMSFRWSPAQPAPPDSVLNRVVFRRPEPDRINSIRDSLRSRPRVMQDDIFGHIIRLERAEDKEEGVVVIDGHLGSMRRRVKVRLSGRQYRLAIRAHEERRMVIASGEVTLERRSWWLRGNVVVRLPSP